MAVNFSKDLIFCNTIKECSLVYSALVLEFDHILLLVNMYHSKYPDGVKKILEKTWKWKLTCVSVLVSSSAEMEVNFKRFTEQCLR